jgi:hypothetical protein
MSSKLALDGRVVVIANPTRVELPIGRVFRVRPIDSTQEAKSIQSSTQNRAQESDWAEAARTSPLGAAAAASRYTPARLNR